MDREFHKAKEPAQAAGFSFAIARG